MPEEFATTIITELGPLKHVENTETVAELLAVYQSALGCTCSQLIQQSAYYTVLGWFYLSWCKMTLDRKRGINFFHFQPSKIKLV